jgi:lysophospholipase L1-like esterase
VERAAAGAAVSDPRAPLTDREISLFGALLLSVPTAGTLLLLLELLLRRSADPVLGIYSGRRLLLLGAVLALALLEIASCRRLLVGGPARGASLARRGVRALASPVVALLVAVLGLEVLLLLGGVARSAYLTQGGIVSSLAVLAYAHAVVAFVAALLLARSGLVALQRRLLGFLVVLGALMIGAAVLAVLVCVTNQAVPARLLSEVRESRLASGNLRQGDPGAFWDEFERTQRSRWLPYTYFRTAPFAGRFHNVGPDGIRLTVPSPGPGAHPRVFVFGGSTVWGVGARDAETIPSHLARLLRGAGRSVEVRNFGEGGYVSTQSLILFLRRLELGDAPDVAVFYEGFNDVYSAVSGGRSGIPLYESNRERDFEAGQREREREGRLASALVPLALPLQWVGHGSDTARGGPPAADPGLVAKSADARGVVDLYLANLAAARVLADAHGVRAIFVWQPHPYLGKALTRFEAEQVQGFERYCPGLTRALGDVDRELRGRAAAGAVPAGFLDLSRVFEGSAGPVYVDFCHLTERGNETVAERLLPVVLAALPHAPP